MSHLSWALARVDEACAPEALRSQRTLRDLLDALLTLRGESAKGVFGLSPASLKLDAGERDALETRIRAALAVHRAALERAGDATSLHELAKVGVLHGLPELGQPKRLPLRCDPLGDASALEPAWRHLVSRMQRARSGAAFRWSRVADLFADNPPKKVELGTPDPNALYEVALAHEQAFEKPFSRELAAMVSIVDGILLDDMWWYIAPAKDWSWEDNGLRIGCGHYLQGLLCIDTEDPDGDLLAAPVVDRDDDGVEAHRFESIAVLLARLLPEE